MDWTGFGTFLVLARTGTLRAAGRELGLAPTTVARRIESLERDLGTTLFIRHAHGLVPTDAARELSAAAHDVEEQMLSLGRRFMAQREEDAIAGHLRVSATEIVTAEVLAPAMGMLLARHPRLRITLRVDAQVVSFSRSDTDLAVRMVRPTGARLVTRKLGEISLAFYAARAYLARSGSRPLRDERFVGYDERYGNIPETRLFAEHGLEDALVIRTSSTRGILQATLAGAGIGLLPTFVAERHTELVRMDAPFSIPARTIFVVTHEDFRNRPAVRAVSRHLAEAFARQGLARASPYARSRAVR